jgi:hypothetical protein
MRRAAARLLLQLLLRQRGLLLQLLLLRIECGPPKTQTGRGCAADFRRRSALFAEHSTADPLNILRKSMWADRRGEEANMQVQRRPKPRRWMVTGTAQSQADTPFKSAVGWPLLIRRSCLWPIATVVRAVGELQHLAPMLDVTDELIRK